MKKIFTILFTLTLISIQSFAESEEVLCTMTLLNQKDTLQVYGSVSAMESEVDGDESFYASGVTLSVDDENGDTQHYRYNTATPQELHFGNFMKTNSSGKKTTASACSSPDDRIIISTSEWYLALGNPSLSLNDYNGYDFKFPEEYIDYFNVEETEYGQKIELNPKNDERLFFRCHYTKVEEGPYCG